KKKDICILMIILLMNVCLFSGCDVFPKKEMQTRTITDQLGRNIKVPGHPKKIAALHHFGGKIIYALNQQHLLVDQSIYGREANAMAGIDMAFAALPKIIQAHGYNVEGLVSLNPEIIFSYASMDKLELDQFENAGIPVVAVKGETFEESFKAIRLISDILDCKDRGETYIKACQDLLEMVQTRLKGHAQKPVTVMFAGPRSIFSVATGNMLQNQILELSGAVNVARELSGFWADVSPEQIAQWNPDVIFLGSYLDVYGKDKILESPQFQTVTAIKAKQIFTFPSNVGWWDYPAPHCVLGVVWSAKTLYPKLFEGIDMKAIANGFYKQFNGHTFEELGGRLY
ncbi:MAG: ABC transporter substrate-binding protein, partial [Proteobacteria bacterium]|nr:ABC transporter substrate-binding protein [Pseudomonadota bacterium]